jgi:hypothetical protein
MSTAEEISLLGYLNTPILVGDPEGCIVYANPCFRRCFGGDSDDLMGRPLAMVFGGGAREVVLSATASVLDRGEAARIQIREGGVAYSGLASPIEAEDDRVGVVMVLLEEQSNEEHLTALADEISEPINEALRNLQGLASAVAGGVGLASGPRGLLERGLEALETAQNSLREFHMVLRGGKPKQGRFDVSCALLRVAERIGQDQPNPVELDVLMPPNLPRVVGSAAAFERVVGQLLRQRMNESKENQPLTLLARTLGADESLGVLVSLVDVPDANRRETTGLPPESVSLGIATMGGETVCVEDSEIGRVTSMRLAVAGT